MLSEVGEHGQGSITRRADGRLQVAVTMLDGRRVFRYVPKDRDRARQRRRAEILRRELVAAREFELEPWTQTLGDFLRSWIAGLPDGRRPPRARTVEHYRYVVERFLIPALGGARLDRLTPRLVQAWIDSDRSKSAAHHYAVLRRALNVAVRQHVIGTNPALAVEAPERDDYTGSPLTEAEARALMTATDRLAPLWRLAIDSGLRESELLGLAWDDVDLGGEDGHAGETASNVRGGDSGAVAFGRQIRSRPDARGLLDGPPVEERRLHRGGDQLRAEPTGATLTLRHQLYRDRQGWHLVPPKTKREGPINLAPSTAAALREHKRRMAAERTPEWRYHGLVFVTPKGEPIGRSDVLRAFHAACDAVGIARRRFHDLRGSTASILQDEGVPEHVRMARLGHVTTKMARHYAGQSDRLDRDAAMALERVLG
jgi:integrase